MEVYCLQIAIPIAAQGHLSLRLHGLASVGANSVRGTRNFEIGNNCLFRLLGIVLHVDSKSICALTTVGFSP